MRFRGASKNEECVHRWGKCEWGRECRSGEVSRMRVTKGNGWMGQWWKTVEADVDLPCSKIMSMKSKGFKTL